MAVPPISPAKNEVAAAAARKASAKRKRTPSSAPQSPPAGAADAAPLPTPKRNKSPGVRVVGGRIYDSEHGKSCHQCRQKTMDFSAACNNLKRGKLCTIRFCFKCLINRYGEKAEEVAAREDWNCPKCRGICNCSLCMKKKGRQPTGILVHTAKATGYSSVSEMLQMHQIRIEVKEMGKDADAGSNKLPSPSKELVASERKHKRENSHAPGKVQALAGRASKSSEEKHETVEAGAKGKSKASKSKRETRSGVSCKLAKGSAKSKENFVGKNMEESLGRCEKDGGMIGEKEVVPTDRNAKKIPMLAKKTGRNREIQACNGSNIVEEKGDSHKDISKENKKTTRKKQMDIRKAFSDGNVKDVLNEKSGNSAEAEVLPKVCMEKRALMSVVDYLNSAVAVPEGTRLTAIAGTVLQVEDVGPALQFLEFCSAFGEVLDIKKGQAESVLRVLANGRGSRRGLNSLVLQFFIKLLSKMPTARRRSPSCAANDGTWFRALKKCITESQCALELPMDWLNKGETGCAHLDSSQKLRLLNFLCDELLGTEEMRSWIDKENVEFTENKKEAREKVLAAKEEEKRLKKKLKDEVAQAMLQLGNGAPLSISEHEDLVLKIKMEKKKAHADVLGSLDMLRKILTEKLRSDAVRTEPILLEGDGRVYWRLKSCYSSHILLQDIGNWGFVVPEDKWFAYDEQQEKLVEKHIHVLRNQKHVRQKILKSRILRSCDYAEDELTKIINHRTF